MLLKEKGLKKMQQENHKNVVKSIKKQHKSLFLFVQDTLICMLAFFCIFTYKTFNSIFIANFIFYLILGWELLGRNKIQYNKKISINIVFLIFTVEVILSTIIYIFLPVNDSSPQQSLSRRLMQTVFTLQYAIFLFKIDLRSFEKYLYIFSIISSMLIITFFLIEGGRIDKAFTNRMWGEKYLPGWPNTISIALIVGLFISFKNNKNWLFRLLISFSAIITTSRAGMLGVILVILYFMVFSKTLYSYNRRKVNFLVLISLGIIGFIVLQLFLPEVLFRILAPDTHRQLIASVALKLLSLRPFLGYGGLTGDQIGIDIGYTDQFHNWILEMLVRYGIVGFVIFALFLFLLFKTIKRRDNIFLFLLLLFLGLFQTYFRMFVYLMYLYYAIYSESNEMKKEFLHGLC